MIFNYSARDQSGQISKGQMEAESESVLAENLRAQNLILTATTINKQTKDSIIKKILEWQRVKTVDKIFFTQNLQVMLKAGLTVTRALTTLAEQTTNKRLGLILTDMKAEVEKGTPLSDSLNKYPKVFPEIFVNMIRAGEKSGKLEEVLIQLTTQLQKNYTLVSKIRGAMTYPIIVIVAMIGIGIAMFIFVIPQITAIFGEINADLPFPTRVIIALNNAVSKYGLWFSLGFILLAGLFIYVIHTNKGRHLWHGLLLKLPLVSNIFKQINLAKFSRTFSSLLKTDIPIVQTFQITSTTLGNVRYRLALTAAAEKVKSGGTIAHSLSDYRELFPPLVIQMSAVGEETGSLDDVLAELAHFYEEEVDRIMSNLSTIIEPVLMLILGAGVGFFAVSIIMPMYSLAEQI